MCTRVKGWIGPPVDGRNRKISTGRKLGISSTSVYCISATKSVIQTNQIGWPGSVQNMVFLLQEISAKCSFQKENDDEVVDGRGCHPSWIFRWKQPSQFMNTRWYPLVDIAMENHHCFFFRTNYLWIGHLSIYIYIYYNSIYIYIDIYIYMIIMCIYICIYI